MHIFQQEYDDGLAEILSASASVSYASLVEPCANKALASSLSHIKSLAALNDQDLYYVQSILVTSSWNKNDDIFDKEEVWAARNTPEDKPTNLEHDENIIIGHITANWPITEDGILIDENTPIDNLPQKFHILTGSVIYKAFSNQDLRDRSEKLISEIENGQKYVSMECLFKGFDYGLLNKSNGEYKILARDNETAYLTKYLRSYGGIGEHENYKIGRVLRNITFSGKGFVNKPANPDSIIFTKDNFAQNNLDNKSEKNTIFSVAGVFDNQSHIKVENKTMSLENEMTELKAKVEELTKEVATSKTGIETSEAKISELEATIKANETQLSEATTELVSLRTEKEEAAKKMAMKEEEMKKMKAELDSALEALAAYKSKEEEMMKKEKKMKRMASLVEAGIDNESAEATVDKFEALDDETFAAMTSLVAGKMPPWLDKEKQKKKEEEAMMTKKMASEEGTAPKADPEILETAEVDTDINLGVGGEAETTTVEATRAALLDFVSSRLGKNYK
jgi:hypothetical protein